MNISAEDLQSIVHNIWSTQLGLELLSSQGSSTDIFSRHNLDGVMTASVQITGSWSGAVHMYCSSSVVRQAAALMFARDEESLVQDDLRDTVGELTNMTAGNIKALLPGKSFISLPVVVDGSDYDVTLISGETVIEEGFELAGQLIVVKVLRNRS